MSATGPDDELVRAAVHDLAQHLGLAPDEVSVLRVEAVTWSDASLGCAEPDGMYAQALVQGHRIVLAAGGAEHQYHAGGGQGPFRCVRPTQ